MALADGQAGIIARRQLLSCGLTPAQARQRIETGHWRAVFPGVYATFTGPLEDRARIWAALLFVGPDACVSHQTALWLAGALERAPTLIHVSIPADRRVKAPAGIRIHLSRRFQQNLHPSALPPRTRLEDTVLDVADNESDTESMLSLVFRVTSGRLTTAGRLRSALAQRSRHRWRLLLKQVLADVDDGVASALERRYAHDVERAHGLPHGERNRAEPAPGGGNWYRDVRYPKCATVVELDGREAHSADQHFRDLRRDNHAAVQGEAVLRYGWRDVAGRPCTVAEQVADVLHAQGWTGTPHPCGPSCPIPPP
jgi:hypothetical protein